MFDVRRWSVALLVLVCLFFTGRAWQANMDLIDGRYRLFMDEQITFDDVRAMLQAPSLKDAALVSMAGDPRYGRGLYNLCYAVAYIPYRIWSDAGLIVADRMLQFALLLAAYFLLTITFVRLWPWRLLVMTALLCLPTTVYYATMPKPEPLQLLCLALFLLFACRQRFVFGGYFFFLGCALGMKVSALVLIPFFVAVTAYLYRDRLQDKKFYAQAVLAFIGGVAGYLLMQGTLIRCLFVRNLEPLQTYLWFLRTQSNASTEQIFPRFLSWLNVVHTEYFQQPLGVTLAVSAGIMIVLGVFVDRTFRQKDEQARARLLPNIILTGAGLVALGLIMFFIGNQQTFYLHTGMVLLTVSGGAWCALAWDDALKPLLPWRRILAAGVFLMWCISLAFLLPAASQSFLKEAGRTRTQEHRVQLAEYGRISALVDAVSKSEGKRLVIAYDPYLYQLDDSPRCLLRRFWGNQVPWGSPYDAIAIYRKNMPQKGDPADQASALYGRNVCASSQELLQGRQCLFVPLDIGEDAVGFFLRADIFVRFVNTLRRK